MVSCRTLFERWLLERLHRVHTSTNISRLASCVVLHGWLAPANLTLSCMAAYDPIVVALQYTPCFEDHNACVCACGISNVLFCAPQHCSESEYA